MPKILKLIKDLTWYNKVEKSKEILRLLTTIFLQDAPEDGNIYGRKDGEWEEVTASTSTPNFQEVLMQGGRVSKECEDTENPEYTFIAEDKGKYCYSVLKSEFLLDLANFEDGDEILLSNTNGSDFTISSLDGTNIVSGSTNVDTVILPDGYVGSFKNITGAWVFTKATGLDVSGSQTLVISLPETEILAIASPEVGRLYYNTTQNHVVFYDGTNWKKISHSNM
jgi:hypothetical protein